MNISSENTGAIPSHFSCWSIYRTGNQIILIGCLLNRREFGQRGRKQNPHQTRRKFVLISYIISDSCFKKKIGVISKIKLCVKTNNNFWIITGFLGAFEKLWKATINSLFSVRFASSGRVFIKFDVLGIFSEICRENSGFIKTWQE